MPSENRPERGKKEAYVGWTGMASASSLANINSVDGDSLGTIEIDPQYAQALGFLQGDLVRALRLLLFLLQLKFPTGRDWFAP